jgi:CelD/BcsL family acetyltransferase involved in cellulose biosynthesis
MLNLSIIDNRDDFYSLSKEWNNLLGNSNSDTIFLRWEWLYNWWLVYGEGIHQLFIVIVRDSNRLLGIAPLYLHKKFLFNTLSFLGVNVVCSDYLDFILLRDYEEDVLRTITSFFQKHKNIWDVLKLNDIPSESNNLRLIKSNLINNRIMIKTKNICPYIDLSADWETVFKSYSSNLKNIIKKKLHKYEDLSFISVSNEKDVDDLFPEFLRLNHLRFEQKKMKSPFSDERFLRFHRNILKELCKHGIIIFYFLKVKDELIAGIYLFHYDNKYYYYQSGFNPAWKNYSPGTLLFHHCIKDAHKKQIREFDFLRGEEEYKKLWTNAKRVNETVDIYNNSITGLICCFNDNLAFRLRKALHIFK